jgi:hypothetical protein
MRHLRFFGALLLLLGMGCRSIGTPAPVQDNPAEVPPPTEVILEKEPPVTPDPEIDVPEATSRPDCLGEEIHPIASSIAADYEFTSYEEVMTWFCNGAEFEDILTALLTEELTGAQVEEMLEMLANGFTWDEIWQVTGLTE